MTSPLLAQKETVSKALTLTNLSDIFDISQKIVSRTVLFPIDTRIFSVNALLIN